MGSNQYVVSEDDLKASIDNYIMHLSEKHRMHRKIQFLLDIRGLLVINHMEGDYVEFGVYRGEMMYAAAKILSPHIRKYIGLDTFSGLPEPCEDDAEIFVFEEKGFMSAPRELTERMMDGYNTVLIQGDFREDDVLEKFRAEVSRISVASIDCNWPSSVHASMTAIAPALQNGSIIFIDDYFVGTRQANFNDRIMQEVFGDNGMRLVEFMTYPPCARAFLVETS